MAKCTDIITPEQLVALREAGYVVIHREPTVKMRKAYYANSFPECVDFTDGFHRMVAQSIREQNEET